MGSGWRLQRFLHDGRLDIDSNAVERTIRPQTITRKNALFAGSDGGGKTLATTRHTPANREDERRRSIRLARPNPSAHRHRLANVELDPLLPFNHHAGHGWAPSRVESDVRWAGRKR